MNEEIFLDIFAKRLTELINDSKTDIPYLAKQLGIKSTSTIYRYMNADMSPKMTTVKILADIYNVNSVWLMGYDAPKYIKKIDKLGNPVVSIPLLGVVKAGYDYLAQENWIGTVEIDEKLSKTGELFALKVKRR